MRINPTEPSSSGDNANDSLGIVFNEHKLSDTDVTPYKKPSPATPSEAPFKNISNAVPTKDLETSFLDGGTIITDKRNKRATLGENLNSAFTEWWGNTKKKVEATLATVEHSLNEDEQEKPVVENPETRADTIRKAAAYTMQAPKDDHASVTEKIATIQQESVPLQTKPIIIKEISEQKTSPGVWLPFSASPKTTAVTQPDAEELSILEVAALKKTKPSYTPPKPVEEESAPAQNPTPFISPKIEMPTPLAPQVPVVRPASEIPTPHLTEMPVAPEISFKDILETPVFEMPIAREPIQDVSNTKAANILVAQGKSLDTVVDAPVPQIFIPHQEVPTPVPHTDAEIPTRQIFNEKDVTQLENKYPFSSEQPTRAAAFTVEPLPTIISKTLDVPAALESLAIDTPPRAPLHSTVRPTNETHLNSSTNKFPPIPVFPPTVSQNNTLRTFTRWGIIVGIVLLGAGLAVFASTKFNIFEEKIPSVVEVTPISIPTLFETDSETEIILSSDKEAFLSELVSRVATAPSGVSQFYPVMRTDTEQHSATAHEIFTTLNTHLTSKTIRSLEDSLVLGSITTTKNEPFMVIRSFNFDVLFSGLLAWEPYLVSDLSPFFGTIDSPVSGFRDAILHNKPTRILYDKEGNAILLYSFTNQNTVIITTSRDALEQLLQKF